MGFFRNWPLQYEPIRPDRVFLYPSERGKIRKYLVITFWRRWKAEKFVFEVLPANLCGQEISTQNKLPMQISKSSLSSSLKIFVFSVSSLLGRNPSQTLKMKSQDVSEFESIYSNFQVLSNLKWNLFCGHLWSLMYQGDKF